MIKMKFLYLSILMLFQNSSFFSQLSDVQFDKDQGYWSVAALYGSSWQSSDVDSENSGWGTGVSLAKNLYFDEDAWLSVDLRSKLFFGVSEGLDGVSNANIENNEVLNGHEEYNYLSNPGFVYNNYKNSFMDLGLEANILFNKFRKESNWYGNINGGIGFGVYNTRMNLSDENGNYSSAFANIDQNASKKKIKNELRNILDDSYESMANGFEDNRLKADIMPSIGIEIGYDITPYLSAFIGNRTTFSRGDHLDGNSLGDPDQDLLNFTHLGLQINFLKGAARKRDYSKYENPPVLSGDKHEYPTVEIVYPEVDWFNTSSSEIEVIAELQNVFSVIDISCMVNGKEVAFDYNKDKVTFFADLQRGTNVLKVQVRNDKGEARDIKRVIFTPEENGGIDTEDDAVKPLIELINPKSEDFVAEEDIFTIQAFIENVEDKEDIELMANGIDLPTFKFDPDIGTLSIKVRLAKGKNKFRLTAFNSSGKSEEEFIIYFDTLPEEDDDDDIVTNGDNNGNDNEAENDPPIDSSTKPYIMILSPSENPYFTLDDKLFFQAELHGVNDKNDIRFLINDRENHFFDFDVNNKILSDEIHLMDLETEVTLEVVNQYGSYRKSLQIKYGERPNDKPDIEDKPELIEFVEIGEADEDCFVNYKVKIHERVEKEDITLTMNEFAVRNFRYDEDEQLLRFSLYLDEGMNEIRVNVELDDRKEFAVVTIHCSEDGETDYDDNTQEVDTSPASIQSIYPQSGHTTEEKNLIVSIKTAHIRSREEIFIFLNDDNFTDYEFDRNSNEIKAMLSLQTKDNQLLVRLANEYGEDEEELFYFYDEPFREAPSVIINSPRNGFETDENEIIFRASVDFIKAKEDVTVYLNGTQFDDFQYNLEYGKIQAYIPLQLGQNTLEVEAKNRLGKSSEKVTFRYKIEHIPAVQITGPKEGLEYRKSFAFLKGIVQNMPDKRGIGIQINGMPFKSLSYDKDTETVSSKLLLEKGDNEIILSAKNEYGFDSDTIHIFFRGAPEKPSITFQKPSSDGEKVNTSTFNLEAEVLEISHSSHVELTVNGSLFEEVYYYKDEKIVRANFPLKRGRNDITLRAMNDTGVSTERISIYFE